jgi:hypothetical protein
LWATRRSGLTAVPRERDLPRSVRQPDAPLPARGPDARSADLRARASVARVAPLAGAGHARRSVAACGARIATAVVGEAGVDAETASRRAARPAGHLRTRPRGRRRCGRSTSAGPRTSSVPGAHACATQTPLLHEHHRGGTSRTSSSRRRGCTRLGRETRRSVRGAPSSAGISHLREPENQAVLRTPPWPVSCASSCGAAMVTVSRQPARKVAPRQASALVITGRFTVSPFPHRGERPRPFGQSSRAYGEGIAPSRRRTRFAAAPVGERLIPTRGHRGGHGGTRGDRRDHRDTPADRCRRRHPMRGRDRLGPRHQSADRSRCDGRGHRGRRCGGDDRRNRDRSGRRLGSSALDPSTTASAPDSIRPRPPARPT